MKNTEAMTLVETTFTKVLNAKTVLALKTIVDTDPLLKKKQMDRTKYPELQLELSAQDVACLADKVDEDLRLHADLSGRLETPLEKLLYALTWKNGDLQKVGHIIKGAKDALPTSLNKGPGQVFRQFGRHLADSSEPIVDQHVLRAFQLYKLHEETKTPAPDAVTAIRKKINWDNEVFWIEHYKTWLNEHFGERKCAEKKFVVNIDMVLFALGRAVKITSKRGSSTEV